MLAGLSYALALGLLARAVGDSSCVNFFKTLLNDYRLKPIDS